MSICINATHFCLIVVLRSKYIILNRLIGKWMNSQWECYRWWRAAVIPKYWSVPGQSRCLVICCSGTEGGRDCHCGHLFIGVECDETEIMGSASLPPPAWTHQTITCYMLYTMSTARDLVATRPRRSLRRWCINCTALKKNICIFLLGLEAARFRQAWFA